MTEPTAAASRENADNTERLLGRYVALGLPATAVAAAIVMGFVAGPGPAILILAAGALLGTIALLWSSVRTLSGDAPLPEDLEAIAARRHAVDDLAEQKGTVLRALKDLEHEHSIGKIDDADYTKIAAEYRERAKEILQRMDATIEPLRPKAEQIARSYLRKRGLADGASPDEAPSYALDDDGVSPPALEPPPPARLDCPKCSTKNELDAAFCKKCGAAMSPADASTGDGDGAA